MRKRCEHIRKKLFIQVKKNKRGKRENQIKKAQRNERGETQIALIKYSRITMECILVCHSLLTYPLPSNVDWFECNLFFLLLLFYCFELQRPWRWLYQWYHDMHQNYSTTCDALQRFLAFFRMIFRSNLMDLIFF